MDELMEEFREKFKNQYIEYEWWKVLDPPNKDRVVVSNKFRMSPEVYREILEWPLVVGDCVMPDIRTKVQD